MTMKLKIATLALALSAAMPAFAQEGQSPIIGAWRMTSLEVGTEGNLQPIPYSGQVIFSEAGVPVHGFETPICAYAALASGPIWSARTWAGVL
jgi:hypothetical protein